jgi:hypothetical protein
MTPVTWRCWLIYQVAALPLSLFCWYATLFWLAVMLGLQAPWPMTGAEVALAIGFWAFGLVHLLGLYFGHHVPLRFRWALLVVPLPWLICFLLRLMDEELSFPGDGLLPASLGPIATAYVVVLAALLVAALFMAMGEVFVPARA